ncbi:hypothetical protein TA3x_002468 [Tundrisphaera sp. TA3]|uniref:hypothetical protein n=1 Tax=Tundrisphaera sp. TA3 TaxID=3435775 RepID=UPI003EBF1B23
MARVPDFSTAALPGQVGSPKTVQCPECGVVLNVPATAAGRRLKCPRCETRFPAPEASSAVIPTINGSSAASSMYAPMDREGGSSGDFTLPSSLPPLRETFDLPLLSDLGPTTPPAGAAPPVSDAMALFQDEPKAARRPKGAEARADARRCPTCSGVVPVGMSLCSKCGLDLDTGQRVETLDLFDEAPAAPRQVSFPMGVFIIGGISALGSVILAVVSLLAWNKGMQGAEFLLAICLFGVYASVQFLRRKSARLLMVALSIGIFINIAALIALPIYHANFVDDAVPTDIIAPAPGSLEELEGPRIRSIDERLDMGKIKLGVTLLLGYAALAVYMNTPSFRRQFARH